MGPRVLHRIDALGPELRVFSSTWPLDRLYSTYAAPIDASAEVNVGAGDDEPTAVLSRNAEQLPREITKAVKLERKVAIVSGGGSGIGEGIGGPRLLRSHRMP